MKKVAVLSLLLCFIGIQFAVSRGQQEVGGEQGEEKVYMIKFGYSEADIAGSTGESFMAKTFKQEVEKLSSGRIKVELYPGSVLGTNPEMVEQTQTGIIEMTGIADAGLVAFYKPIQAISIPYMFKTHEVAYRVLDSDFMKEMYEDIAVQAKVRVVARCENGGFRCFTNSKRTIRNPNDMQGLKFRVMGSPLMMDMVKNLGASAISMPMGEVYTSLQTGVMDGQENAPFVVRVWNVHEVQKYYTLDKHTYSTLFLILNEAFYKSLPADLQEAVMTAGEMTTKIQRRASRKAEEEILAFLTAQGMEIYDPSIAELNMFKDRTQKAAVEMLKAQGLGPWIDGIIKTTDQVDKELGL